MALPFLSALHKHTAAHMEGKTVAENHRKPIQKSAPSVLDCFGGKLLKNIPHHRQHPSEPGSSAYRQIDSPKSDTNLWTDENYSANHPTADEVGSCTMLVNERTESDKSVTGHENIDPSDKNCKIIRSFNKELERSSKSWVYDWILDLGDSENSNCTSGSQWQSCVTGRSRGFEHPSIIREELQFLQTKMV